jgi:putative Mg2+ transporter-C (MgtC) family protein
MPAMEILTRSLRGELASPWLEVVLVLAAVVCGAMVGSERERHHKSAGLRTLILVCLGSAVFTMLSFAFAANNGDSGRVAAQVVTGIGFLGAGAILHSGAGVSGMTTAATIWMTAAVGMAVGAGYPLAGVGLSVLLQALLAGVRRWEVRHLGGMKSVAIQVVFDPDHGKTRIRMEQMREEFHVRGTVTDVADAGHGLVRARIDLSLPRKHLHEFLNALVDLPAVKEIREIREAGGEA